MGGATISGPQGTVKTPKDGSYTLVAQNGLGKDWLNVKGTFENSDLKHVDMQIGNDVLTYDASGQMTVNGQPFTGGTVTTPDGTTITKNGDTITVTTAMGDSFSLSTSICPAINMSGQIAPDRGKGNAWGLVGNFNDDPEALWAPTVDVAGTGGGAGMDGGELGSFFQRFLADEEQRKRDREAALAAAQPPAGR